MKDLPMRILHTQFTKIKNLPMNSPKRLDNYFESKSGTNAIGKI